MWTIDFQSISPASHRSRKDSAHNFLAPSA